MSKTINGLVIGRYQKSGLTKRLDYLKGTFPDCLASVSRVRAIWSLHGGGLFCIGTRGHFDCRFLE